MHKRCFSGIFVLAALIVFLCSSSLAYADETDIFVTYNGKEIKFDTPPVIIDDVTLVEVRPLAKALGCSVKWSPNTSSVKLTKGDVVVVLKTDSDDVMNDIMTKNILSDTDDGNLEYIQLAAAPYVENDVAYVPLRSVVEAFGASLEWDEDEESINIYTGRNTKKSKTVLKEVNYSGGDHTFFFQNQSDWELPGFGSGYCWTCSYAMLISDVTGELVTPLDVAEVNEEQCGNGAYCYHWDIADSFGVEFVSALDKNSPYYGGRDSNSGGTLIDNPDCDEDVTIEALKEALDRNPAGVMVRYASYPHTMVAIGYENDTIFFNEPMQLSRSEYYSESSKCGVPFEETCVAKRGISIAQLTFMQALNVK